MRKINLAWPALMALIMAGCAGSGNKNSDELAKAVERVAPVADLSGKWSIEKIMMGSNDSICPAQAVPGQIQTVVFEDDAYAIHTNCNTFTGTYQAYADTIIFEPGLLTEMACDNMLVEDAIRSILPHIATFTVDGDSSLTLRSDNSPEYITLRKMPAEK